jgi:membrane-associated phospholipid phosphatase
MRPTLELDGRAEVVSAIGVVVGNVGTLTGGMVLFPNARPDDGVLDVAVLTPKRLRTWAGLAVNIVAGRRPQPWQAQLRTATKIVVRWPHEVPVELDGDLRDPATEADLHGGCRGAGCLRAGRLGLDRSLTAVAAPPRVVVVVAPVSRNVGRSARRADQDDIAARCENGPMEPAPPSPAVARSAYRSARASVTTVAAGLTIAWIALVVWVNADAPGVPTIDSSLHGWALDHRTDVTIQAARVVSWFGQTTITLPLIFLGALAATASTRRFGRLRAAALLFAMGAVGPAVGLAINMLVGRVRPPRGDWAGAAGGFALPSGHATAATIAAGLIAWSITRRLRTTPARAAVWVAAVAWAAAVGWSRVWLGVHWPTDVLCGWLFAASFLLAARAVQLTWWPADAPPEAALDH